MREPEYAKLFLIVCSSENLLRRALFEDTGGMYPELITRPDIKVFLPPIGNLTVYICASALHTRVSSPHMWPASRKPGIRDRRGQGAHPARARRVQRFGRFRVW